MSATLSTVVASISLAFVVATSIPAFLAIFKSLRVRKSIVGDNVNSDGLYEDKDGLASQESQQEFSTVTQRVLILVGTFVGLFLSVALAVFNTTRSESLLQTESWVKLGCWVGGLIFRKTEFY